MLYIISHIPFTYEIKYEYIAYGKRDNRNSCIFYVVGEKSALVNTYNFKIGDWLYYNNIDGFRLLCSTK